MTEIERCPICNSNDILTTQYEEEGCRCRNCDIWVVPESSAKGIYKVRGSEKLSIQFHKNGIPTKTWDEFVKEIEDEQRGFIKPPHFSHHSIDWCYICKERARTVDIFGLSPKADYLRFCEHCIKKMNSLLDSKEEEEFDW